MVIIIHDAWLLGIIAALGIPYVYLGVRAVLHRRPPTLPTQHGLRRIE
jgi:hypothetical protein